MCRAANIMVIGISGRRSGWPPDSIASTRSRPVIVCTGSLSRMPVAVRRGDAPSGRHDEEVLLVPVAGQQAFEEAELPSTRSNSQPLLAASWRACRSKRSSGSRPVAM